MCITLQSPQKEKAMNDIINMFLGMASYGPFTFFMEGKESILYNWMFWVFSAGVLVGIVIA